MARRPKRPVHQRVSIAQLTASAALLAACAALIGAITGAFVQVRSAERPSQVLAAPAQRQVVEQAAIAPNPSCRPAAPATMGSCQPVQAIAAAQAVAPEGNDVTAVPNVNKALAQPKTGGLIGALLATDQALAAGSKLDRAVDVSSYQGCSIDWPVVRRATGITWAVAKVTESSGYTDACVRHNVAGFKQARLLYSLYHFDRTYVSPEAQADRAVATARSVGGLTSMPLTVDAESNDAGLSPAAWCGHVYRELARIEQDTHRQQAILYTARFIWPGCTFVPPGTALWDAAYGPSFNVVSPFAFASAWQHSDGLVGPTPHLLGWDSDLWLRSHAELLALAHTAAPAKPIPYAYWLACSKLDAIEWWKQQHGHVSSTQHQQAVTVRVQLRRGGYGCSKQPHSYPVHGNGTRGNLA